MTIDQRDAAVCIPSFNSSNGDGWEAGEAMGQSADGGYNREIHLAVFRWREWTEGRDGCGGKLDFRETLC